MEGNSPKEKLRMNPGEGKRYFAPKDVHTVRLRAENRGVDVLLTQEEQISVEFIPVEGKDEVEVYDKDGEFFFCQRMRFRPIADVWSLLKSTGNASSNLPSMYHGTGERKLSAETSNGKIQIQFERG